LVNVRWERNFDGMRTSLQVLSPSTGLTHAGAAGREALGTINGLMGDRDLRQLQVESG
jgi:hypothetical protein